MLEKNLQNDRVKAVMMKGIQNFGYNIDTDDLIRMWNENYRRIKSVNLRENVLKMFHRWHLKWQKGC